MKTKRVFSKKKQTKKQVKEIISENGNLEKIQKFLGNMKSKINKCPYVIDIFKNGSISKNAAGMRVSEVGSQIKENYGQLFFYDLVDNAMRVPHWHSDGHEIGLVLEGKIRVTIWNGNECEKQVFTAEKMGSWFIPKGTLHCLENFSDEKSKFLVCYDNPDTADRDFIDAWEAMPSEIICASTFISPEDASIIKRQQLRNRLSKFEPTKHLAEKVNHFSAYSNNFNYTEPTYLSSLGEIRRIDPKNTVHMIDKAWQKTILKPGSLRIPHWYTSSNVLLYVNKGSGFVSMLDSIGDGATEKSYNFYIKQGNVLALPVGFFHCILNIENEDLEFYEAFMSGNTNEISILKGIQALSNDVASGALGLSKEHSQIMLSKKAPDFIVRF